MLAIYGSQSLKERRSAPRRCATRRTDHHLTARNDRLLIGNCDSHASIKSGDRGVDANESRCSSDDKVWRRIKDCVAQLLPAQPNKKSCARMGGGKLTRRGALTTDGECDKFKAFSVLAEHLKRLRANRSGCSSGADTACPA